MHIEWAAIRTLAIAVLVAIGKAQDAKATAQSAQKELGQSQAQAPEPAKPEPAKEGQGNVTNGGPGTDGQEDQKEQTGISN